MSLLHRLAHSPPRAANLALLILRLGFGLTLAFTHGLGKITALGKFVDGVAGRGVPMPWVLGPAAALSEFAGGILLAVGLLTRPSALFVSITMLVAAFHIHAADPFAKKELALAYALAAGAILVAGPGRYSLDAAIFGRKR